ncbi:MAG: Trk system potassium transporter TrkA [Muribaculaceae bacterium]|nr:Trk system potassium transporter TrkA [Muribaculaceae bacterium]
MRIIIAGDGDTGTHLANTLSIENQDIVLMGSDRTHLAELESTCNLITYAGSVVSVDDLAQCGISEADLFVAVTNDENLNLVAAQIAKGCGARRCVARIDNPDYLNPEAFKVIRRSGIDAVIYPELYAAREIVNFITHNWVREWFDAHDNKLIVVGVKMTAGSPLVGNRLKDTAVSPRFFHVSALKRMDDILIPRGDTEIKAGDILYFSVLPDNLPDLYKICGGKLKRVKKIMITGGGHVTENLLTLIDNQYDITVIESDPLRCRHIASRFGSVTVVNTTANDVATLKEEGIAGCDLFLALTRSSEKNIVSCMVAREHGVEKTLARIEELQYIPEAESLSIDKIINKKLLNVSKIFDSLIESNFNEARCMLLDSIEIIKLTARHNSKIVSRPISQLSLPQGITIGGLIRDGKGMLVEGCTRIEPGDYVLVFGYIGSLPRIEKLFS